MGLLRKWTVNSFFIFLSLFFVATLFGCKKYGKRNEDAIPFIDRKVYMALTPGYGDSDLSPALNNIFELGFDGPGDLNLDWGVLEPNIGAYVDPDGIINWYSSHLTGKSIHLTFAPIQTTYASVPAELEGLAWDDSLLIDSYLNGLEYIHDKLGNVEVSTISLGNEVDVFLGEDSLAWKGYVNFFNAAKDKAKELWPNALIGVKLTHETILNLAHKNASAIVENSDALIVTYYPAVTDKGLIYPQIEKDFKAVVDLELKKPIHFVEVGYPTSKSLNSSEKHQVEFVCAIFEVWDRYAEQVPSITFVWLYDLSTEVLEALSEQYGITDSEFVDFLGTIGYASHDKKSKKSLDFLRLLIANRR